MDVYGCFQLYSFKDHHDKSLNHIPVRPLKMSDTTDVPAWCVSNWIKCSKSWQIQTYFHFARQECILVGCVSSTAVAVWGRACTGGVCASKGVCLGGCPGGLCPRGVSSQGSVYTPRGQNSWHTRIYIRVVCSSYNVDDDANIGIKCFYQQRKKLPPVWTNLVITGSELKYSNWFHWNSKHILESIT